MTENFTARLSHFFFKKLDFVEKTDFVEKLKILIIKMLLQIKQNM